MAYRYYSDSMQRRQTLYCSVMDCFGGEIISLTMDDNMKKELCIKAAKEAYKLRKPKSGFLFHSDAGSQYTSLKYKIELGKMHAI